MLQSDTKLSSGDTLVEIAVHPDQIRVLVDPLEPKSKSRALACVAIQDLYESGIGEWLEANVRYQKMTTQIARDIVETLEDKPQNMHPLNRGLTVLSNGFRYETQTRKLMVVLRDKLRHGIIDGGHTFRAVETVVESAAQNETEAPRAFVNVEILAGYDDIAPDIISARNSVFAVRDSAIYSLEGVFEELKDHLVTAGLDHLVAFKQNEEGKEMSVEEVIAVCTLFHPSYAEGSTHPTKAYTSRAGCVELYAEEWKQMKRKDNPDSTRWREGFGKIIHLAPAFLRLREEVELLADETFRAGGGFKGYSSEEEPNGTKEGRARGRRGKEFLGPRRLVVTGKDIRSGWPTGYLYPVLGSLRPLLDYSGSKAVWRTTDPLKVFNDASRQVVKTLMEFAELYKRKPNAVGKESVAWRSLYTTMENACLRALARNQE
jgi:hypothetical protein